MSLKRTLGVVYDTLYLNYIFRKGSVESPERLGAIVHVLKKSSTADELVWLSPVHDIKQYLLLVHTEKHIDKILQHEQTGKAALLVVGGAISGVDTDMTSKVSSVFCAIHPPGHHARNSGIEEGFCYFNNAALAVRYAQKI